MAFLMRIVALAAALYTQVIQAQQLAAVNNATIPTSKFITRPQSKAPAINITQSAPGFAQGYIFLAPYNHPAAGPYIYDKFGNLVWDGFAVAGSANAQDFKVCQYKGSPHLCFTQVDQKKGYGYGIGLILYTNYHIVATVQTGNDAPPADMHEFDLVDNGQGGSSALLTAYATIPYDLSAYNITKGQGWLLEGVFQEVDVETGDVLFEWYSTNHVDPSESLVRPNASDTSGDGFTPDTAWDYFHINSIAKTAAGNYLVSARHTSTIYHINGTDRSIIWRLSSEGPSDLRPQNFRFGAQHDARILSDLPDQRKMTLSVFDNAFDCPGPIQTSPQSSGMVIDLDFAAATATLARQYTFQSLVSCSQGNVQVLSNRNTFVGWGDKAWFSEFDPQGELVLAGTYTDTPLNDATAFSYRVFSAEWSSVPVRTKPSVIVYARNEGNGGNASTTTDVHVSWNGATDVTRWNYYVADQIGDVFVPVGWTTRQGFETLFTLEGYHAWVMVEAVAADGTSLRNSSFQPAFVPSAALVDSCDAHSCAVANAYTT